MRCFVALGGVLAVLLGLSGLAQGEPADREASVEAVTAEIARLVDDETETVRALYREREHRPAWRDGQAVAAFAAALHTLDADGLRPEDYRPDDLVIGHRQAYAEDDSEQQARFDLHTSQVLLTVLAHLKRGKVDPHSIDTGWEIPAEAAELDPTAISRAVEAQRFEQAFAEARPGYTPYERLRSGLARYRTIERLGGWASLPPRERALRPGDLDDDVLLLRERLAIMGELEVMATAIEAFPGAALDGPDPRRYDERLDAAVRRFQRRHLLEVDGIVGAQTLAALNVPVGDRIDQIRLNMERARWLLHGLPESFVLVDIAGYQLSYFRPNGEIWRSRIVVGQPYRRTPSLRSDITHMTVNPTWTIPPTILREDVLPRVRQDLGYLWRERIQVLSPSGVPLNPWEVDWSRPGNVVLRQSPGPHNALGQVVIRFPNDHMVYLHDTPAQGLFAREQRAFSSGCIRVQDVLEFAQLLFDDTDSGHDVQAQIANGQTRNVPLAERVPVILHYWTVHPADDGELAFRPDIYGRDEALLQALDRPLTL
ncbi:L,D-transpeptidase family protein [Billgrantia endophytica]|uniref:Murein L,D-transpeptidase n=1 Tax=Billgrantia endophytica TaxID=2033802 RepID=A0A2N7TWF2_9GAMM|nr:L,D-transpeptidase family protein [Halomonas endophytica]PMR72511.1 murein L,D-transpeptidase [Halomonas endophytica]